MRYCLPTFIRDIHKRVLISTADRESPLRRSRAVWVGGGTAAALLVVIVNPSCLMENIKQRRRRRKRRKKEKNPFVPRWRMRPLAQTPTDSYTNFVITVTDTKKPVDSVSARSTTLITGVQVMWGRQSMRVATAKENPECM